MENNDILIVGGVGLLAVAGIGLWFFIQNGSKSGSGGSGSTSGSGIFGFGESSSSGSSSSGSSSSGSSSSGGTSQSLISELQNYFNAESKASTSGSTTSTTSQGGTSVIAKPTITISSSVSSGGTLTVNGSINNAVSAMINWGTVFPAIDNINPGVFSVEHYYWTTGTYNVTVTAYNSNGDSVSQSIQPFVSSLL